VHVQQVDQRHRGEADGEFDVEADLDMHESPICKNSQSSSDSVSTLASTKQRVTARAEVSVLLRIEDASPRTK
jgi:hypothetical protein